MNNIDFFTNSISSVKNTKLKSSLRNTTNRFRNARDDAVAGSLKWEELRDSARQIKKHVIENLDLYLSELEESVIRAGGVVHWARDAEEARNIIIKIARTNNVKNVVKSKSMATEEIELNTAFEKAGIESVETDLGEYILQLSSEPPSHIIAPAIHKTKDDISKLFSEKFSVPYSEDPQVLTALARKRLRDKFLNADMGVSGANFAVAETGTIVIVENEGNARLSTSLPNIHVALMGIEKIIPKLEHLSVFLSLLARSATGQKSSSYVSFITGNKRAEEVDGPRQFHLVLLDNGRSGIIESEETRESLYCIRCGACLNICPVYRHVGGHSYGWVYSGPIGAVITPQLAGLDKAHQLPFASTLCGACKDVCPVKIDFPKVLLRLRKNIKHDKKLKYKSNNILEYILILLWKYSVTSPRLYTLFNRFTYFLQYPFNDGEYISHLPYPLSGWTRARDFPAISKRSFRKRWEDMKNKNAV